MVLKLDVHSGEVMELTDDEKQEAVKAVQSGQGTIKQTVTLPDGSKKEMIVWGGYELDGYDRTLKVFMNNADIDTFISIITKSLIEPQDSVDPCKDEEGIEVTVDYMDVAATTVLRKGRYMKF